MQENNATKDHRRADIYRLLSACYYQPEDAFLEENLFAQLATALENCVPELAPLATKMADAFRQDGVEALLHDYSQLFLGPFVIPAKPYGSVYLEGDKVIMGDSTVNVTSYYQAADFAIADDFHELPDHIAVELEFLYLLCFKQSQNEAAVGSSRWWELEQKFLANHLGCWVGRFADNIKEHAKTDFYRLLAELTERFIERQKG